MKKQIIIPPKNGWKEQTYYVIEVAYGTNNMIHTAILAVGFINDNDTFGGYTYIFGRTYDPEIKNVNEAYYMKALHEIDMTTSNEGKIPKQLSNLNINQNQKG